MPAPQRNAVSPKSVIAGHGVASQQRRSPADVEVVADDLLEEDPTRDGFVQHLGQGELGLQDRQVVAVARGAILAAERVRQDGQPLAQQSVDRVGRGR